MQKNWQKRFLCQERDCFGHLWDVMESRPTAYDWPVLLGYPAVGRQKGGITVIPTQPLRDYLEEYRMDVGKLRLPIGIAAIHRLRDKFGMNCIRDRERWWRQVKQELLHPEAPPVFPSLDTDRLTPQKVWPKAELRRLVELAKAGKSVQEIAGIMEQPEKAVYLLYRRFFGIRKPQHPWTDEDNNTVVRLKKQGYKDHEIAAQMGRKIKSVRHKMSKLAPPPGRQCRTWTDEERQKLIELAKENRSVEEIMEIMSRTRQSIIFMRRRVAGIRFRQATPKTGREYATWTDEEHQKLKELALAGHSIDELAKFMGRTRASVIFACRETLGLKYSRKRARYVARGQLPEESERI